MLNQCDFPFFCKGNATVGRLVRSVDVETLFNLLLGQLCRFSGVAGRGSTTIVVTTLYQPQLDLF